MYLYISTLGWLNSFLIDGQLSILEGWRLSICLFPFKPDCKSFLPV